MWGPKHYRCFRASCGRAGWGSGGVAPRAKEARYFTKPTIRLTPEQANTLSSRFGLDRLPNVSYSPDEDRFIYGVHSPEGWLRGHMSRSYSGKTPKTIAYRAKTEEPWMHWTKADLNKSLPVVVVEDIVSAEKAGQFGTVRGVALLGTHMELERAEEIRKIAQGNPVYIALDKDATGLAIKHYNRFGEVIPFLQVLALDKDLKDMARQETWGLLRYATDPTGTWGNAQQSGGV